MGACIDKESSKCEEARKGLEKLKNDTLKECKETAGTDVCTLSTDLHLKDGTVEVQSDDNCLPKICQTPENFAHFKGLQEERVCKRMESQSTQCTVDLVCSF